MTNWIVEFHEEFLPEFEAFAQPVQDELAAMVELLAVFGPHLKRPGADTLNGSDYANMKELRFEANKGVWRVAYAFDPERKAILLVAGDKAGVAQRRFYRALISKADERFSNHLKAIAERKKR
jgi:hypothetical protein